MTHHHHPFSSQKSAFIGDQVVQYFDFMSASDQERIRAAVVRGHRKAAKAQGVKLLKLLSGESEGQPCQG